jgi:hypothetical protein
VDCSPFGEHGVDESGELVGGGGDRFGLIHARAHPAEVGARAAAFFTLGGFCLVSVQALQLLLDLLVALGELGAIEVEAGERLFERKQVLGAPAAL